MFFPGCATGFHAPSRRRNIYSTIFYNLCETVLHDTAGMQPMSFSSCQSRSPNERVAATSLEGPAC